MIKPLSDAGRFLCDYHYRLTQERRPNIINTLNKETKDAVKTTKSDKFLLDSDLVEHIKSSKDITKSETELKQATFRHIRSAPSPICHSEATLAQSTLSTTGIKQTEDTPTKYCLSPKTEEILYFSVAGRLRYFYNEWCKVTNDSVILLRVKGYIITFTKEPIQSIVPKTA